MKQGGFFVTKVDKLMSWAHRESLWAFSTGEGCCANEFFQTLGCRYDLERLGSISRDSPEQSDLLIVSGLVTLKMAPELKAIYQRMPQPRYVMALGACACNGGAFGQNWNYSALKSCEEVLPVDVFVPGCPPRPEAIMNGLLILKEKISGEGLRVGTHSEIL